MSKILYSCEWLPIRAARLITSYGTLPCSELVLRCLKLAQRCFEARQRRDGPDIEDALGYK